MKRIHGAKNHSEQVERTLGHGAVDMKTAVNSAANAARKSQSRIHGHVRADMKTAASSVVSAGNLVPKKALFVLMKHAVIPAMSR